MLLSSDQQVLLRAWFAQTRAVHDRVQPYDVPNLPGRCRLEDAKRLCALLEKAFQAVVVPDSACLDSLLDPYLLHVRSWAQSCADTAASGDDGSSEHVDSLSAAVRAFVLTLGSLEVQAHNARNVINRRVPDDVFILVLGLLSFKDCLAVASVCHRWRKFALAFPTLWTDLALYENGFGRDICLVNPSLLRLVQRSKSAPLSFSAANARRQSMAALSSCLTASLGRMKRLDISFSFDVRFPDTWLDALRQPAAVLEVLQLASGRRRNYNTVDCLIPIPADIFMGHAPRLRKVYLGTLNLPDSCPALAGVRSFTGHFVDKGRGALSQDVQTRLVYQLCPRLEKLEVCYIEGVQMLPTLPAELALESVVLNTPLATESSYVTERVYRAISGLGDLASVRFAKAVAGDTNSVMRLWCDPLQPWHTVSIQLVKKDIDSLFGPVPEMINISVQCGEPGPSLKTREFALTTSYLRQSSEELEDQILARMASARICIVDPRALQHFLYHDVLEGLAELEELHLVLADDYERTLRRFEYSPVIPSLPTITKLVIRGLSTWKTDGTSPVATVRVCAENLTAFLQEHIKAPRLESLVISPGVQVDDVGEISRSWTDFSGAVTVK